MCGNNLSIKVPCKNLTFIEYLEAAVWATVVSGEEQIQEVRTAKKELRDLSAIKRANHRWKQIGTIMNLQEVITELGLKPWKQSRNRVGKRRPLFIHQIRGFQQKNNSEAIQPVESAVKKVLSQCYLLKIYFFEEITWVETDFVSMGTTSNAPIVATAQNQ